MTKTTHLAPHVASQLSLEPVERARRMLVERFISHERLTPIMDHIAFLCLQPPQTRASGLVVSGKPGSGKTMLATAVRRRFPPPAGNGKHAFDAACPHHQHDRCAGSKNTIQPHAERARGPGRHELRWQ